MITQFAKSLIPRQMPVTVENSEAGPPAGRRRQKCAEARKLAVKSPTEKLVRTSHMSRVNGPIHEHNNGSVWPQTALGSCAVLSPNWVIFLTPAL
jgi:hypothetical protein